MAAVAEPYQYDGVGQRSGTPVSEDIDKELDWLIEQDKREQPGNEVYDRRRSPSPGNEVNDRSPSPLSDGDLLPSPPPHTLSTHPPSYTNDDHKETAHNGEDKHSSEGDYSSDTSPLNTPQGYSPENSFLDPPKNSPGIPQKGSPPNSPKDSPVSSPRHSPGGSRSPSPSDKTRLSPGDSGHEDDYDLQLSDDQRKANAELANMKLDLGYRDDEPPPEYDVTERVRQLNQELANEPSPDDNKERSIKFKENLVDLVAPPPPDDSEDDNAASQDERKSSPRSPTTKSDDEERKNHPWSPLSSDDEGTPRSAGNSEGNTSQSLDSERSNSPDNQPGESNEHRHNEKIVVERNGKFEFLNAEDLTAEEREMYNVPDPKKEHRPKPPSGPRPKTASGQASSHGTEHNKRRVQSAKQRSPSHNSEWDENFTYQSPYAMTPEQKRELAEKNRDERKKKGDEERQKQKSERNRSRDNDDAFGIWLRKKREQASQRGQSGNKKGSEDDENEENRDPDGAYKEWVKTKKDQSQKEKKQEQKEQNEFDEGWYVRPRKECDKAYKEWLKKKNGDLKKQKEDDKQKARIHRLWLRRSRKSQQLAKAIRQAQSFRYVDYYGYRESTCSDLQVTNTVNQPQCCSSG